MVGKARKKAQLLVVGEYKEQYLLLHRYAAEILRANSHNTVKFSLDNGVFQKVYICFSALKLGLLAGCRPFISIDGCFLKGPFGGQLLVAVGRDGNNQMFPIVCAVVEVESTESWSWFMSLLAYDLGTTDGSGYTIMSDQQKGLLRAVSEVWPQAESRCCARHVYVNFRDVFGGGLDYRRGFWAIAKSTTENDFHENIGKFRLISNSGANDLLNRNYKKWCRAFYTPQSQCDNVDNNMSEVFNAYILKFRHKPIISMLEEIRESLMERLHKKIDVIAKKEIFLCPRIKEKLYKAKIEARGWSAYWDGRFCFGVRDVATQVKFVVNLRYKTCTCRSWQLSGIPCNHAIAAIWKNVEHPEHYVAECYHKTGYLKAYQFTLEPLNGPNEWPISEFQPINPPPLKKLRACRPKTKRRMPAGESSSSRLTKSGGVMRCSKCGESGHNKRKCKSTHVMKVQSDTITSGNLQHSNPQQIQTKTFDERSQQFETPMHQRGYGIYTYPDGFTRLASMVQPRRRMAYYSDNEGQQTIQSVTNLHDVPDMSSSTFVPSENMPISFIDSNGKICITGKRLQ
ncbi:hypothetical protein KSS87_003218, partial [Heliosperma pusillum]